MDELWRAALALGVAVLAFQVQQGGRRRRRRREIREELELLEKLGDGHEEIRERLSARVQVLLHRYEPSAEDRLSRRYRWLYRGIGALSGLTAIGSAFAFEASADPTGPEQFIVSIVLGLASAAAGMVIMWVFEGRRVDDKVDAEVIQLDTIHVTETVHPGKVTQGSEGPRP